MKTNDMSLKYSKIIYLRISHKFQNKLHIEDTQKSILKVFFF